MLVQNRLCGSSFADFFIESRYGLREFGSGKSIFCAHFLGKKMDDHKKTKNQLIDDLSLLRQHLSDLEKSAADNKRQMKELRESEERYWTIVETTNTGYVIVDSFGLVIDANAEYVRMTGHENLSDILGRSVLEWTAVHEKTKNETAIRKCMQEGHIRNFEIDYVDAKGNITPVEINATVVDSDTIPRIISICRDITSRKLSEETLRQSEEKYRTILENINDGYYEVDLAGNFTFFNDALRQIYAYPKEELLGLNYRRYTDQQTADSLFQAYNMVYRHGGPGRVFDYEVTRKDGEKRYVEVAFSLLKDASGKTIGFGGITRDITGRKRMAEALKDSENRLSTILEANPTGIILVEKQTRTIAYVNQSAAKMIGLPSETIVGRVCHRFICPADVNHCPIYDLGLAIDYSEKNILRQDGSSLPIMKAAAEISVGGKEYLLESFIDISKQKQMEKERQKLEERLLRAEKMESLGTLAGGVAHDLNNVLGVLVGYSELLLEKIPATDPTGKYVANILASSEKGAAIIQDLLTLARRGVSVSEVVNLNNVITDYFKAPEFEKLKTYHKNVTFKTLLESDLANIKGSPVHLSKTIMNLISNAAEAISDYGEVSVKTANFYLDKPVSGHESIREGEYAVLTITDNGKGISKTDINKIFEPFYTKKVMGRSGTGLGLAVVWGTMQDHQGYIDVQSEEGKGSTFTLYFPVTGDELTAIEKSIPVEFYMGRGESILIVDDVSEQRELATTILTRLGYNVDAAASGLEAIGYLKAKPFDLMVIDMIMDPGIDGLETYQRALEINPLQKAIIVSGFSQTERVSKATDLGVGAYVKKPYILERIGMAIRKELDKK
jgi:PAS domain S-box/PAS domain S-box/PAS domain S-box